jgi:transaldolase
MPIEIFYDGLNVEKYADNSIKGFTTNCTLFADSPLSYTEFYNRVSGVLNGRPISFQIWKDDLEGAIQQVNHIHHIDPAIFVKIPIVNTHGDLNKEVIHYAMSQNIPMNITCIHTSSHLDTLHTITQGTDVPLIVSVFAGPISDTGVDPTPTLKHANNLFKSRPNTRILWAGCREIYTIIRAEEAGCDIITIPDSVIGKLNTTGDLDELTILRVKKFQLDAKDIII